MKQKSSARQRSGGAFKPNSHSVKSWARHLKNWGHAPINIRNPERYENSSTKRDCTKS